MTIDLTPIISAVITLAVAVTTALVIPLIRKKLGDEKYSEIQRWVQVAVEAAEQMFRGSGRGAEKLEYVESFLANKGFNIDSESLRNLIESAVWSLSNSAVLVEGIEAKVG